MNNELFKGTKQGGPCCGSALCHQVQLLASWLTSPMRGISRLSGYGDVWFFHGMIVCCGLWSLVWCLHCQQLVG
jgi:hypothetical protein